MPDPRPAAETTPGPMPELPSGHKRINDAGPLTWGLCIATLNRIESLESCVRHALAQTRPLTEIVIVDASEDWQQYRQRIAALVGDSATLTYLPAPRRSLTAQRNAGIAAATADICFLIDDDSFMHPDCAEEIMRVYEHKDAASVLSVTASDGPPVSAEGLQSERKAGAIRDGRFDRYRQSGLFRWFWRNVVLMAAEKVFIPYDGPYQRSLPEGLARADLAIVPVSLSSGYKMTARRSAALAHPFEDAFESYSPAEDLDFFYRLTRHGHLVRAAKARIYHHEVAATRIKRQTATLLSITNIAFLVSKHSRHQARHRSLFAVMLLRRFVAELIKDAGSRRWSMNQTRAVLKAIPASISIFRQEREKLPEWYNAKQKEILKSGRSAISR